MNFETSQFFKGLRRIHEAHGSFVYPNEDGTLKFVLRDLPEAATPKRMVFELAVVVDEDEDPRVAKALELDNDGWMDEDDPSAFVLDDFELEKESPDPDDVQDMLRAFKATKAYKICPCAKYLIKDGGRMCFHCELTATEEGLREEECPICLDAGVMMHMKATPCCGKLVHESCSRAWLARGRTECPFCRREDEAVAAVREMVTRAVRDALMTDDDDDPPAAGV